MPNGYGMKRRDIYYQNLFLLYNQFNFGISDNFSLGAGVIPLPLGGQVPFWLSPKVSLPLGKKLHIGVGGMWVFGFQLNDKTDFGFGLNYGVLTYGIRDMNVSVGAGFGFNGTIFSRRPVITVANLARVGRRIFVITENYLLVRPYDKKEDASALLSGACRIHLGKSVGLDLGVLTAFSKTRFKNGILGPAPWLGLSVRLRNR